MDDLELEAALYDGPGERIASDFEFDIRSFVVTNYDLTVVAIARRQSEEEENAEIELESDDPDVRRSHSAYVGGHFERLREAARELAVVALVTRLQHWAELCLRLAKIQEPERKGPPSHFILRLEALNKSLGEGPVPVTFFEGLETVRDSVVHANCRAVWQFKVERRVAHCYTSGGSVAITEDQLKDAFANAIKQVDWIFDRIWEARPVDDN